MKNSISILIPLLFLTGCAGPPKSGIERAKKKGIPLVVSRIEVKRPNSAGGVGVKISFTNTSNRTLKYVLFSVEPYNRVGDIAPSEIGGKTSVNLQSIGPIKPDEFQGDYHTGFIIMSGGGWSNVWYNHSIYCINLTRIDVTYMDGRTSSFDKTSLHEIMGPSVNKYVCRDQSW